MAQNCDHWPVSWMVEIATGKKKVGEQPDGRTGNRTAELHAAHHSRA